MSELAYNMSGESFEPPASTAFWRVRRLKPGGRGTPDVIFGADGRPVLIAADAEVAEFRRLVKNDPGRYRLDALDENHKPCEGGMPSYLQLSEAPEGAPQAYLGAQDELLRDVVRTNSDMVKCIADRFANVMDSAATLIRAADGAGIPAREPLVLQRNAAPELPEPDDEGPEEDDSHFGGILAGALKQSLPMLIQLIHTRVVGITATQSAEMTGSAPAQEAGPAADSSTETSRAADPGGGTAAPEHKNIALHLREIEKHLTAEEVALARAAIPQMPPQSLAAWSEKLLSLSPEDAAAMVREEIMQGASDDQ